MVYYAGGETGRYVEGDSAAASVYLFAVCRVTLGNAGLHSMVWAPFNKLKLKHNQ